MSKQTSYFFIVAAFLLPFSSNAATIAELQTQIQTLMAQVGALQSQITIPPMVQQSGEIIQCPNIIRTLSRGIRGTDVIQLQDFLIQQGHLTIGNSTGYFGTMTEIAVKKFQCKHMGLCSGSLWSNGYGQVGPTTRQKIAVMCIAAKVPIPTQASSSTTTPTHQTPPATSVIPTTSTIPVVPMSSIVPTTAVSVDTYVADVQTLTANIARGLVTSVQFVEAYHAGFVQEKYSYAPSVVRIGSVDHIFTCANAVSGVFRDQIDYTMRDAVTGAQLGGITGVILPSIQSSELWDRQHICDPSVIALKTRLNAEDFNYAMFFTANAKDASEYNQIGFAVAKDIGGPWIKYPYPLVYHPQVPMLADNKRIDIGKLATVGPWGVGQPTATAVDDHRFLLAYEVGDSNGTRVEVRDITINDLDTTGPNASTPRILSLVNGEQILGGPLINIDMAYYPASDRMIVITDRYYPVPNKPAPKFISDALQMGSISGGGMWGDVATQWTQIGLLDVINDGESAVFRRHHNAGIVRNKFGGLADPSKLEVYWTSSCTIEATFGVRRACPSATTRPEFTYEIWKSSIPISL